MIDRLSSLASGRIRASDYPGATGAGVRVAVIDSGVFAGHPHVGEVEAGMAFGGDGAAAGDTVDRLGHGTAVAAAIREKAPQASIVAVKVFDGELRATGAALVAAIDWAVAARVDVINLSLGTANPAHQAALGAALIGATRAGICLVAAGEQDGTRWLPGSLPLAVGVTVDWTCPRDEALVAVNDEGAVRRRQVRASGYPRPIPGVSPERNLKGVSFAVANVSGLLSLYLSRMESR